MLAASDFPMLPEFTGLILRKAKPFAREQAPRLCGEGREWFTPEPAGCWKAWRSACAGGSRARPGGALFQLRDLRFDGVKIRQILRRRRLLGVLDDARFIHDECGARGAVADAPRCL